jgi:hypothetical protein
MPVVDYRTWYREEQRRRGINPDLPPVGVPRPIQQPDMKPSVLQEVLASPVGQEVVKYAGKEIFNALNPTVTQAAAQGAAQAGTQAATQAAAQGAAQAGTQAAAQGATQAGTQGATQAGASTASTAAGALGTAANVYGAIKGSYDLYKGLEGKAGAKSTAMSGASAGAAIGSMILPGVGTLLGAAIGGLVGAAGGALRPPPKTQVEDKRWRALARRGFDVPQWVKEGIDIKDTGFRQDLAADFVGFDEKGAWVNNKFAKSRDEKDLLGQDVSQYAVMPETFGSLWTGATPEARQEVSELALQKAKVREHKGTLDINWDPSSKRLAQDILAGETGQGRAMVWVPPTWEPPEERMRKYGKLY